jgi:hypothetical protein
LSTEARIQSFRTAYTTLATEIGKVIVGQQPIVDDTLIAPSSLAATSSSKASPASARRSSSAPSAKSSTSPSAGSSSRPT